MKKLLALPLIVLMFLVPVVSVNAQSYNGATIEPEEDGETFTVTADSGDTVTLNNAGGSGNTLDVTFSGSSSGSIVVKKMTERPSSAPTDPEGTVSIYFDVDLTGGLTNDDIGSATWRFTVEKSFINGIDGVTAENIFLSHYNGSAWERLPTTQVGETDTTFIFEAEVSNFSPFAVTAVAGLSNTGSPYVLGAIFSLGAILIVLTTFKLSKRTI